MKLSAYKINFTQDTLDTLKKMKRESPALLKEDACKKLGTGTATMNKSADRAGLRGELSEIFPPRVSHVRTPKKRDAMPEGESFPLNRNCPHVRAAIMDWRVSA